MLAILFFLATAVPSPLARAIEALGGEETLNRFPSASIVMVGTSDLYAVDQGFSPRRKAPQRYQETLLVDADGKRAAMRTEAEWGDGSYNVWRYGVMGDTGYAIKVKSGNVSTLSGASVAATLERMQWRVPQLALRAMRDGLTCNSSTQCRFKTIDVLFSPETGDLVEYRYTAETQRGPVVASHRFKPYVNTAVGRFPSGYTFTIGDAVNRDVNLVDARPAKLEGHKWFEAPPANAKPVSRIPQLPPGSIEPAGDGVWYLRNVGGHNAMFARTGDCVAVFDAPANFSNLGGPIPSTQTSTDLAAVIIEKVKETTGARVCYVIPTHHHNDHFGAIAGFARAGATIVTTPGNEELAHIVAGKDAKVEIVRGTRDFGTFEVRMLTNDTHAAEMLFVFFPKQRIVFEGDLSDYQVSARNLLRYIELQKMTVDRVFGAHGGPYTLDELNYEEPFN